jgi:2',3'-cyclic-nucleotide 2'-phosphodiesterase
VKKEKPESGKKYRILFIGDIVARHGRRLVAKVLPGLIEELSLDYVIANGENATTGHGLTIGAVEEMVAAGVDYFTTGNHVWRKEEFIEELNKKGTPVIRPANYLAGTPGRGYQVVDAPFGKMLIINLLGAEGISPYSGKHGTQYQIESPFITIDKILQSTKKEKPLVTLVDIHAEWTSEKVALGHYLDSKVTAVVGTHTHIATADNRILPGGTAYVTDVGMTGPLNSVLGIKTDIIIDRFKGGLPQRFEVAGGDGLLNAVLLTIDDFGKALSIERIDREIPV